MPSEPRRAISTNLATDPLGVDSLLDKAASKGADPPGNRLTTRKRDGRHTFVAALMLGYEHLLVRLQAPIAAQVVGGWRRNGTGQKYLPRQARTGGGAPVKPLIPRRRPGAAAGPEVTESPILCFTPGPLADPRGGGSGQGLHDLPVFRLGERPQRHRPHVAACGQGQGELRHRLVVGRLHQGD